MTPPSVATRLLNDLDLSLHDRVIEPNFGDGAFVLPLIERFLELRSGSTYARLEEVLNQNVFGVEIDPENHARCLATIQRRFGTVPARHNLVCADFFEHRFESDDGPGLATDLFDRLVRFDAIVGNPPFGGSINPQLQDALDRDLGFRNGLKI